ICLRCAARGLRRLIYTVGAEEGPGVRGEQAGGGSGDGLIWGLRSAAPSVRDLGAADGFAFVFQPCVPYIASQYPTRRSQFRSRRW
ncbi:Hypothetical predicted protein, partial [Marmota monax]